MNESAPAAPETTPAIEVSGLDGGYDGKVVLNWQGSYNRLAPSPVWRPRDAKAPLLVGSYGSRYYFTKIQLTPVSGQGKKPALTKSSDRLTRCLPPFRK